MNTAASVQPDWKWATRDGSRQLDQKLTLREKLEWLEQTETVALCLCASREMLSRSREFADTNSEKQSKDATSAQL
jgi:hypothetical protein